MSLFNICKGYRNDFFPMIRRRVTKPPAKLRCGIARGQILSIGEEKDFVGPCINVASRLQKLGQFSFAFSKRGFSLDRNFREKWKNDFVLIKYQIRGVGEEELLFVLKEELDQLPKSVRTELSP